MADAGAHRQSPLAEPSFRHRVTQPTIEVAVADASRQKQVVHEHVNSQSVSRPWIRAVGADARAWNQIRLRNYSGLNSSHAAATSVSGKVRSALRRGGSVPRQRYGRASCQVIATAREPQTFQSPRRHVARARMRELSRRSGGLFKSGMEPADLRVRCGKFAAGWRCRARPASVTCSPRRGCRAPIPSTRRRTRRTTRGPESMLPRAGCRVPDSARAWYQRTRATCRPSEQAARRPRTRRTRGAVGAPSSAVPIVVVSIAGEPQDLQRQDKQEADHHEDRHIAQLRFHRVSHGHNCADTARGAREVTDRNDVPRCQGAPPAGCASTCSIPVASASPGHEAAQIRVPSGNGPPFRLRRPVMSTSSCWRPGLPNRRQHAMIA